MTIGIRVNIILRTMTSTKNTEKDVKGEEGTVESVPGKLSDFIEFLLYNLSKFDPMYPGRFGRNMIRPNFVCSKFVQTKNTHGKISRR